MCNGDDDGRGCFVPWCTCACHHAGRASIHPVAVPAHKPTRSERQTARDHASRPDRVQALVGDLHADVAFHGPAADAVIVANARRHLAEFRPHDVLGWLADLDDLLHPNGHDTPHHAPAT